MTTKTTNPWSLPNGDECALDGWHYREGARYSRCLGDPLCPVQALIAAAPALLDAAKRIKAALLGNPSLAEDALLDDSESWYLLTAAIAKAEGH